jgi:opacity protein-like surface antigen
MTKAKLLLFAALGTALGVPAKVEATRYVSGKLGFNEVDYNLAVSYRGYDLDSGTEKEDKIGFSLAFGSKYDAGFRFESEIILNEKYEDKYLEGRDTISLFAGMLNFYHDIKTESPLTLYIGVGIGVSNLKYKVDYIDGPDEMHIHKSEINAAYQLTLGVLYTINDRLDIDIGYRYTNYGELSGNVLLLDSGVVYPIGYDLKVDTSGFYIGAKYAFN